MAALPEGPVSFAGDAPSSAKPDSRHSDPDPGIPRPPGDLDPALTRIGPAGWPGSETDAYALPAGTPAPPGLALTDPGGANGCGVSGSEEVEMVAAGARDGRYRYHPVAADGSLCTYPYIYYFAEDDTWNLRTERGGTVAFSRCQGEPLALPPVGAPWESFFGALREPHPVVVRHTSKPCKINAALPANP